MNPAIRFLGLVGVFVFGIVATAWLSNSFKSSDMRHAVEDVQAYKGIVKDAPTLQEYINTRYGIASTSPQPEWRAQTQNTFYGVMTVSCTVINASPAVDLRWKVGVVNALVMPDNPAATELMDSYDKLYNNKK